MGENQMNVYIMQVFRRTESSDTLITALRYFMFEDQRNPLYLHALENTIFIYTIHGFWNMNSLSMMARSHLRGDYFMMFQVNEYDGLLPAIVWEKKKDAMTYFSNKVQVLNKYKRKYTLDKLTTQKTFLADSLGAIPTAEETLGKEVESKKRPIKKKKSTTDET